MTGAATSPPVDEPVGDEHDDDDEGGGVSPLVSTIIGVAVMLLLVVPVLVLFVVVRSSHGPETVTYTVPAGTGERIDNYETVQIVPTQIRLNVGDTLEITNNDSRTYRVGPYTIRPGETVKQTFRRPQSLLGGCTLNQTGQVRIVVT